MSRLTHRQARFVADFVASGNATKSAIQAGYAPRSAAVTACQLLRNPNVAAEIKKRQGAIARKLELSAESLIREMAWCAYSDIGALFDENGRLRPIHTLPEAVRASIASVEVKTTAQGERVTKVRLWSKPESQRNLAVAMGLARNGRETDERAGMAREELRAALRALTPEQREQFKSICKALAAARHAEAQSVTAIEHDQGLE